MVKNVPITIFYRIGKRYRYELPDFFNCSCSLYHHAGRRPCSLRPHVLLRVFQVLRCRGRARTSRNESPAAPSAAQAYISLQALSDAPIGSVHCPAISAPLAPLMRARGLRPEKPSASRETLLRFQGNVLAV